jgi:hypothetical protein
MSFDSIIDDAYATGRKWLKLETTGDKITGTLNDVEKRNKTDLDGNIVLGKKTGAPRTEWVLTLTIDERLDADDDGVRKLSCNESAQSAIKEAIKRAGIKDAATLVGAQFAIQRVAEPESKFSQASYAAQLKPATPKPSVDLDDLFG